MSKCGLKLCLVLFRQIDGSQIEWSLFTEICLVFLPRSVAVYEWGINGIIILRWLCSVSAPFSMVHFVLYFISQSTQIGIKMSHLQIMFIPGLWTFMSYYLTESLLRDCLRRIVLFWCLGDFYLNENQTFSIFSSLVVYKFSLICPSVVWSFA